MTIHSFSLKLLWIIVETWDGKDYHEFRVPRLEFESFVDEKDKREFVSDGSNHMGYHEQETGTMTWDEYYGSRDVEQDLIDFISKMDDSFVGKIEKHLKTQVMKKYDVTISLIRGYYEDGDPITQLVNYTVEAETEEQARTIAKDLDKSHYSVYESYADEII